MHNSPISTLSKLTTFCKLVKYPLEAIGGAESGVELGTTAPEPGVRIPWGGTGVALEDGGGSRLGVSCIRRVSDIAIP